MNSIVVIFAAVLALATAKPQGKDPIAIVSQVNDQNPDGSYRWSYETANGIKAEEVGSLQPADDPKDGNVVVADGQFSYTADDGTPIALSYKADKNGFQPEGAHLPTPPPIPEAIQKALQYIASLPSTAEPGRAGRR